MSLPKPEIPEITWEDYITAPIGQPPTIGRHPVSKESNKLFKATLAMVSISTCAVFAYEL